MSLAKLGMGLYLKRGDGGGGSEVFTPIAEIVAVSGPGYKAEIIDVTHTDSPSSFREKLIGLRDAGKVTATCNFLNDSTQSLAAGIIADFVSGVKRNFKVGYPSNTADVISISGYVTGVQKKAAIGDKMQMDIEIDITGLPTEA